MKRFIAIYALLFALPANAADRAIMANEQEIAALVQLIDEALKSKGVSVVQNSSYWLNKLHSAPIVTERKDDPVVDKPKE